jgi:cellulose synthase/poly-beta-1,6-N-acetylglucosamine synthase-like glycosyltransferase
MFWVFDVLRYMVTDVVVSIDELDTRIFRRRLAEPELSLKDGPLVSVIMAGHNEADSMPLTLASLREQTYENLEVVVVDDGSTDGTSDAVQRCIRSLPPELVGWCRLVRFARRNGKAAALNLGLMLSRGEYIVYVDADTTFDRDAIAEVIRPMRLDPDVGAVGGNIVARNARENVLTQLVALEYLFSISVGRRFRSKVNLLNVISGAFGAFRRELVVAVGGHTPTSGNDGDLTLKVRRLTKKIVFAHRALCLTKTPAKLKPLIKQRRRWDRNLIKNKLRRHRDLLDLRSRRFRFSDALLVLDALFFCLVLGLRWLITFGTALLLAPETIPLLFVSSYLLYLAGGAFQLFLAQWLQPPRVESRLSQWLYVPLYPLYKWGFRAVRIYSYIEETARQASYADVFAPRPVSLEALRYDNAARLSVRRLVGAMLWPFPKARRPGPLELEGGGYDR